jgi:gliding motility-associated-like protein
MLRYFLIVAVVFSGYMTFGQATLYSTDFENPLMDWTLTGDAGPNTFIKGICAGNGASGAGVRSMYISQGGPDAGCGATGVDQYSYTNSASGSLTLIAYTTIDGTCASALKAKFDYRLEGSAPQDHAELIYSTNGGSTWNTVSTLAQFTNWTASTISLPGSLDYSTFLLGVSFTYDNTNVSGFPLAIDNFRVQGTDTQAPVVTCSTPEDQSVNASCLAIADDYSKYIVTLSDNCTDSASIVVTQSIPEFSTIPVAPGGSTSVILTVTDESGNTDQCTITLNIIDGDAPVITVCPPNANIPVNGSCSATLGDYTGLVTATDNCGTPLTITQSPAPGLPINGAGVITTVTITVKDAFNNTDQCTFDMTTIDNTLPTITCPGTQTLNANAACQATLLDYTGLAVYSDNCVSNSSMFVSQSPLPSTVINSNQTITLTLTGGVPSTPQTCQFTVQLIDVIAPNVICPTATVLNLNSSCEAAIPDYTGAVSWSDNCTSLVGDMTFTQSPLSGTLVSTNQVITITAEDASGNSSTCTINQTVQDIIPPSMTCPSNQNVNTNAACFAVMPDYTTLVTDVENCFFVTDVVYSQLPAPGATFNNATLVTISGTDESGNVGTCSFTVTPVDVTAPSITCPSPMNVGTNSGCNYTLANLTGGVAASDNCTSLSSLIYSQSPAPGTSLPTGTSSVTITVTDASANSNSCSFNVTVTDQTAPTALCPGAQSVSVASNCLGTLGNYTGLVTLNDNCNTPAQLTLTQSPVAGSTITGNTVVTMTVTDQNGNSGSCNFTATVIDTEDPVLTCPSTYDVSINSSCQYAVPDLSGVVTGTDNCSSFGNMTLTQNPPVGNIEGSLTAVLITLTDEQGNSTTCITTLTPIDNIAPQITCPTPAPVNNGTSCNYTLGFYGTLAPVLDNCSDFAITQTPPAGTVVQAGITNITLEVMDVGGNTAQCSFDLVVIETLSPTITCPSNIINCDPVVTYIDPVFSDNCVATLTQTDATGLSSGDSFPIGITTLTYTATDASGNAASCSFQIQVLGLPTPAVIAEDTISLCQVTSTVVQADPVTVGTGEWTLASGQATFNNQFAEMTGVNNLGYGTNVLVWTVTTPFCGTSTDTVRVIVSQPPLPASALDTLYACNTSSVQLSAGVPLYGTGTWTTQQGATIADVNLSTSAATNLSPGWNLFIWTVTNGACPSTADTMNVFVTPVANIAQADTALCIEDGAIVLNGTTPLPDQSVSWIFISGSGHINDVYDESTTLDDYGLGTSMIVYVMDHDDCPSSSDTLTIVASLCEGFNPVFPTVITPNFDGRNDLFVIDYLEKVYPDCKVTIFNRWGSVVYESVGYEEPWDGTYNGEDLPMGTYFYKVELNDENATVYDGPISIIR